MALTPPTLTGYSGKITDEPTITFTTDALWEAAITEIRIGNDKASEYTVSSGSILISRDDFKRTGEYTITIYADGYDNAGANVSLDLAPWSDYVLFDVDDLIAEEPAMLKEDDSTSLARYHNLVKEDLGQDLENFLYKNNTLLKRGQNNTLTLLDYIRNPLVLKQLAMYRALCNIFEDRSMFEQDQWTAKAKTYRDRYLRKLNFIPKMIEFTDVDFWGNELPPRYRQAIFPSENIGRLRFTR